MEVLDDAFRIVEKRQVSPTINIRANNTMNYKIYTRVCKNCTIFNKNKNYPYTNYEILEFGFHL